MLDYKSILVKRFALGMSGRDIAKELGCSKSGINKFLVAFSKCDTLGYPLPREITNYAIHQEVYGAPPSQKGQRHEDYEEPDFERVNESMKRQNMTLLYQWGVYKNACAKSSAKPYSYRQFCSLYQAWCDENGKTAHFDHLPGQTMEIDFAGKTFRIVDPLDGAIGTIYVFVAVLPYSQYIYAEGMADIKEAQWIEVNNNALDYFGGVPQIVVCDNCKQAVIANKDWIEPSLNKDFAGWAEHNGTAIMPAKVKKPKFKPSVEGAVGIMEKGMFHDLEERIWTSLADFNEALWRRLECLNSKPFEKREHNRKYYFEEEKKWLLKLPSDKYQYAERREATVSSDFHIRFDNAYYSCPAQYAHCRIQIKATATHVKLIDMKGAPICEHLRATRKGQWVTDPSHLPSDYNSFRDWSPDFFERKAALIGPSTSKVILAVLASRKYQVQTYRSCCGILKLGDKYGSDALEKACSEAVKFKKANYNFVKNAVLSNKDIAEKAAKPGRNESAYLARGMKSDLGSLLQKTEAIMKGGNENG